MTHWKGKKTCSLDSLDGFQLYWHDKEILLDDLYAPQVAAGYEDMFQRASLLTEATRLCADDWVFQQDNACLTKDFYQENNVTLLDHPACSPHLNPIENIWGSMAGDVNKNRRQCQNMDALCEALIIHWATWPPVSWKQWDQACRYKCLKWSRRTVGLLTVESSFDTFSSVVVFFGLWS